MICSCKTFSLLYSLYVFELWGIHCYVILLRSAIGLFCGKKGGVMIFLYLYSLYMPVCVLYYIYFAYMPVYLLLHLFFNYLWFLWMFSQMLKHLDFEHVLGIFFGSQYFCFCACSLLKFYRMLEHVCVTLKVCLFDRYSLKN